MSGIDLSSIAKEDQRKALVDLAALSESAERYDDMVKIMSQLVLFCDSQQVDLCDEERNLLSVAYKNVVGARRSAWRSITDPVEDLPAKFASLQQQFKVQVESEIEAICAEKLDHYAAACADINASRIWIENPCYVADQHWYPALLCHELAHNNGWPAGHPR